METLSPVVVQREIEVAPSPQSQALDVWSVELVDGQIQVGGAVVHRVVARDLWRRLGELLDESERSEDRDRWEKLAKELDRHFAHAVPARARTLGGPSVVVEGVVLLEDGQAASLRVATFSIATLRRTSRGWEGPVWELRPTGVDHYRVRTGVRVRVPLEGMPAPRLALPEPPAAPKPATRLEWWQRRKAEIDYVAPVEPRLSDDVRRRRAEVAVTVAAILAIFPAVGDQRSFDELSSALRIQRGELRDGLAVLVERGELAEPAPGTWMRTAPPARGTRRVKKGGTRFVDAPKRRAKVGPKAPVRRVKPPPPEPRLLRCDPCNRSVQVPEGTPIPDAPLCGVCRGPMRRWTR